MLELHFSVRHTETNEKFLVASDTSNYFFLFSWEDYKKKNIDVMIPFENQKDVEILKINTKYRHYKGTIYKFYFIAGHIHTKEKFIIYSKKEDEEKSIYWACPFDIFFGNVMLEGDIEVKRFVPIDGWEAW